MFLKFFKPLVSASAVKPTSSAIDVLNKFIFINTFTYLGLCMSILGRSSSNDDEPNVLDDELRAAENNPGTFIY